MSGDDTNHCKVWESDCPLPVEAVETNVDQEIEYEKSAPSADLAYPVYFVSIFY